jgi:hypothetical protein
LPKLRGISGEIVIKVLCNQHDELKPGTLRSVLKLAKVDPGEFAEYL